VDRGVELELVDRLRGGDAAAFDAIYAAFNARLFTFLARLARSRDVAEDLLAETWLRLVAHGSSLRADTQLAPWLFTVARNLYASYCRSRLIEATYSAEAIALWPTMGRSLSPFEATAANEVQRRLEIALAQLPASYREALLLVGGEGLRPAEAAAVCGVSPEAMRQRLSRARAALAERLEALNDDRRAARPAV
jgi:RNA polymerase sigma-70 factor (ECF subfamily)